MRPRVYWIAVCLFTALVAAKFSPQTGLTSLIRFGETWEMRRHVLLQGVPIATVRHSHGYDGQFYAQIALDPLLRDPDTVNVLDAPVYRARRILTPAAAAMGGFGNPGWTLQVYALLNIVCWFILAWLLAKALPPSDPIHFARWLGCMFGMGVLESVRQSLVDLPALLLLVLAISAQNQARTAWSTLWLALGNLAKESNLLGTVALCLEEPKRPYPLKRILFSLILAAIPLLFWAYYVSSRLPSGADRSALGNFTWPLLGLGLHLRDCLTELAAGNWDGRYSMGLLGAVGFVTQIGVLWRHPNLKSGWWRTGAAYSILFLFLSPWVWSGYWAVSRVVLPMTVAFNLLLPSSKRTFWPLWVLGNASIVHAVWRFL